MTQSNSLTLALVLACGLFAVGLLASGAGVLLGFCVHYVFVWLLAGLVALYRLLLQQLKASNLRLARRVDEATFDLQAKTDALTLADSILQSEAQRDVAAAKSPHVTQVGDIRLDARLGQSVRAQSIEERRDRLASRVDFYVNPSAVRLGAAGGINATWSP